MKLISRSLDAVLLFLFQVQETFRRPPAPCSAPLISGTAPKENGSTRPLLEFQIIQLDAWLHMNKGGWKRLPTPPVNSSYMIQLEHSDGTTTVLHLFSRTAPAVYFAKHTKEKTFDAGWLFRPVAEIDSLITMLRS